MGKTFWEVVSAAVEQSRCKANMVAQGEEKFGPLGWPQVPSKPKKIYPEIGVSIEKCGGQNLEWFAISNPIKK